MIWKLHTRQIKQLLAGISKQIKLNFRDLFERGLFYEPRFVFWISQPVYGSLRGTKILGVYLFKINIYSGTYRYPEFAGISNSLTDIATGNRRVICLIKRCGRYLVDLKYMGLAFFIVLVYTWFDIIWRRISTSMVNMISHFFKSFSKTNAVMAFGFTVSMNNRVSSGGGGR